MFDFSWLWPAFWWLVGIAGVGGAIACIVLFPSIVIPLLTGIVKAIIKCTPCLVVLALLAVFAIGNQMGQRKQAAKCQAANLRAELARRDDDLVKARDAADDARGRITSLQEGFAKDKQETARYVADLKKRAAVKGCIATAADVDPGGVRQSWQSGTGAGSAGKGFRPDLSR